ncbi:MAG: TolC family protein, partial [Candidatus Omnitrophota bacterium]
MKKKRVVLVLAFFILSGTLGYSLEQQALVVKELSINEVSRLALENSLDIQIVKYDAYIKRTDLGAQESIFDTFLNAEISYDKDKTKPASSLAAAETTEKSYSLELEKKLSSGTTVTIGAVNEETKSNASTVTLRPARETSGKISIVQELGKNFFGIADRGEIKITKIDIENSEITSLDSIEKALYDVQQAYWDFVLKNEESRITENMFEEAKKLFEIYKQKNELGTVEYVDLIAAEANMKVRENNALEARLKKNTSKNELLFLLNEEDLTIS